jgi:chromosome segregation ATPase
MDKALEAHVVSLQKIIERLEAENERLTAKIEHLKAKSELQRRRILRFRGRQERAKLLSEEVDRLTAEIERLKAHNLAMNDTEAKFKIEKLEYQVSHEKRLNESCEKSLDKAVAEIERLKAEIEQWRKSRQFAEDRAANETSRAEHWEQRNVELHSLIDKLTSEVERLKADLAESQQRRIETVCYTDMLTADNAAMRDALSDACWEAHPDGGETVCFDCGVRESLPHDATCVMVQPHPGDALLAELKRLRAVVVAVRRLFSCDATQVDVIADLEAVHEAIAALDAGEPEGT